MSGTQKSIDDGETFLTDLLSAGELSHFGVLGMHWGVRKSRNADIPNHADHEETAAIRKKKVSQLSTAELRTANSRRQAETQYRQLNPTSVDKGKKAVTALFGAVGAGTSVAGTIKFINSKEGKATIAGAKNLPKATREQGKALVEAVKFAAFIVKHPVEP